jgi:hypothetical protein
MRRAIVHSPDAHNHADLKLKPRPVGSLPLMMSRLAAPSVSVPVCQVAAVSGAQLCPCGCRAGAADAARALHAPPIRLRLPLQGEASVLLSVPLGMESTLTTGAEHWSCVWLCVRCCVTVRRSGGTRRSCTSCCGSKRCEGPFFPNKPIYGVWVTVLALPLHLNA